MTRRRRIASLAHAASFFVSVGLTSFKLSYGEAPECMRLSGASLAATNDLSAGSAYKRRADSFNVKLGG